MGEVFLLWVELFCPEMKGTTCRVVKVWPPFKDFVYVLQVMQNDCKEAF
jgi:hypothetical protein